MHTTFNIDEILQMAEQIERNGAIFYRRAAELATDDGVRRTLLMLAAMEDDHEDLFTSMQGTLGTSDTGDWDLDGQAAAYLNAVAGGHVFDLSDPTQSLDQDATARGILKQAIGREKDAITFFVGLKSSMPASWGLDRLDEIIAEELSHIALLSDEIKKLKE